MIKRVGVTGGIGTGKSYVCQRIAAMDYPVYDCDSEARRLMMTDPDLVQSLQSLLGPDVFVDGRLNKTLVADFLFRSAENARQLNSLVHPVVRREFVSWTQRQSAQLVFIESAILFEAQFDHVVDFVICVAAPMQVRLQRVMQRDRCTAAEVERRVQQQLPVDAVQRRSDYILVNDGILSVDNQIKTIVNQILSC